MMRRKQVIAVMSIAVASFLFGTMFSFTATVTGDSGSPWDRILTVIAGLQSQLEGVNGTLTSKIEDLEWQISDLENDISTLQMQKDSLNASLIELQGRVNAIEEGTSRARTIRFCDPTEHFWNQYEWATLASFTWAPQNTTENAILSVTYFFEYNASINISTEEVYFNIMIDGWNYPEPFAIQYNRIPVPHGYVWSPVLTLQHLEQTIMGVPYGVKPNAPSHQLEFRICVRSGYMNIWVKNINIIIVVVDGLPAEN